MCKLAGKIALLVVVVILLLAPTLFAQKAVRNPQRELAIRQKLTALAPAAVPVFDQATQAMDNHEDARAEQLFRQVLQQVPDFTPAMRRLAFCVSAAGRTDEALPLVENAVKIDRSADNLISLAEVLAFPSESKQGTEEQQRRALTLAKEATALAQNLDDSSYAFVTAQIALNLNDTDEFRSATDFLVRKFPDQMTTHYFHAIAAAMDEHWITAEDEIKKAGKMGLPAHNVQAFLDTGVHTRALAWRAGYFAGGLIAAWALGLLSLFLAGKVFSRLTLRFIENADMNSTVSPAETTLRRYYRGLINLAGSYYYLSIPFVIFLVLAVTAGIVYAFLALGRIPIKLVLILVVGAVVTVYKMIHSLFVKVNTEEPGRPLAQEEAPGLWNLAREVAEKLGTRPLDAIRVSPGTEMAVYERGSYSDRRKGLGKRTLIMGLGLIPGFDQNPFRAVLAHEYGHLAHADTAGGDVALRVNQDMMKFAIAMARAGQAVWWNLGFQFLRLYHFLFRRISHGATRLQEVLADRASARLYGAKAFEDGLRHVVRRGIEFHHFAGQEIEDALKARRALQNIYALEPTSSQTVEEKIEKEINRQTSEDDTHPSPADRFRLLSRVPSQAFSGASAPMWDLFADRDAITKEMNQKVENLVRQSAS